MLALIAGQGDLPKRLADAVAPAIVCVLRGQKVEVEDAEEFQIEHLGTLMESLKARRITELCFAGGVTRPSIDPREIDDATAPLVPKIAAAIAAGDDGALRTVLEIFEDAGFVVRAAHELMPELLPPEGVPTLAKPEERDHLDAERGASIVAALGKADLGQACCVAAGQALALEALGGTDWMLSSLSGDRRPVGAPGGILYKAPKPDQDRRVDLPTIGPETVAAVASAGLSGIVIAAGGVMVLDMPKTVADADAAGLFLWVRAG